MLPLIFEIFIQIGGKNISGNKLKKNKFLLEKEKLEDKANNPSKRIPGKIAKYWNAQTL